MDTPSPYVNRLTKGFFPDFRAARRREEVKKGKHSVVQAGAESY